MNVHGDVAWGQQLDRYRLVLPSLGTLAPIEWTLVMTAHRRKTVSPDLRFSTIGWMHSAPPRQLDEVC
jgi:hypothetical protein